VSVRRICRLDFYRRTHPAQAGQPLPTGLSCGCPKCGSLSPSPAAVAAQAAWVTYQEALDAALGADGAWDVAWVAAHAAWVAWDDAARAAGGEE